MATRNSKPRLVREVPASTTPEINPATINHDAAGRALDIKSLAMAGKALFEAEDDGEMSDLGRLLGVIAERADNLYADLMEGGAK